MRVKHKKWAEPLIEAHPEKITTDPAQFKGKWQSRFAKEQPIWLEVGMGKGQFAIGMAKAHPEVNFIGLDVVSTVAGIALKKSLEDEELPNLQFICANGAGLDEFFASVKHSSKIQYDLQGIVRLLAAALTRRAAGRRAAFGSPGSLCAFGGALGAWITGLVLSVGGYISSTEAVTQPASALLAIRIDFALIPVVLLAVIGVCSLAFAKLEPKTEAYEAEKKAKIEAQKAEADSVSGN